ncbi:F0F1 ATP synthase subunit epsilon [Candidatus Nitronereus thalassa]|uniref:ATP synthase epsilon chain n=1 Tax=Candidatus Nitronereus thalassa TaxID=3020898 RepID=A0ABU3K9E5_9BACT|nr:F0F1 ATP synthase subunit epsilon [Candidatus Nitronereus thalassa]MDT7042913.1 F0F1 ATP synthase subunit epsilon [Candidatus Nitronereus thalassa]
MATSTEATQSGKILLEVVTPDKLLLSEEVDQVSAPGTEGDFGVLPGHCHFLSTLRIGELNYRIGEKTQFMSVLWGFAEVTSTKVTILAEIAEKAEDIDVERAKEAVAKAEAHLERGGLPSEVEEAKVSLEKARLRQKVAERLQKQGRS